MAYQVGDLEKYMHGGELFFRDPLEEQPIYYKADPTRPGYVNTANPCYLRDPEPYESSSESSSVAGDSVVDSYNTVPTENNIEPDISSISNIVEVSRNDHSMLKTSVVIDEPIAGIEPFVTSAPNNTSTSNNTPGSNLPERTIVEISW